MTYTTSLKGVPDTVQVGESFTFSLEVCCTSAGGCGEDEFSASIGGQRVIEGGANFAGEFCVDFSPGAAGLSPSPPIDLSGGELVITEPGTYLVEGPSDARQLTVEGTPFDKSAVSVNCAGTLPSQIAVGDQVEVGAEVINNNDSQAGVVVGFAVGAASTSKTVTVAANSSRVVSDTFEAASAGEVSVSVNKSEVAEDGLAGASHEPGTPTF